MKFCKNCGNAIDDNAIFCPRCGAHANGESQRASYNTYGGYGQPYYDTSESTLLAILSFIFWQVGLIVWLFCRQTRPGKARSAAKGLLSSFCVGMPIVGLVIWVLWKDDYQKKDYARVSGISAIVGAVLYVVLIASIVGLTLLGADMSHFTTIPFGGMAAMINLLH